MKAAEQTDEIKLVDLIEPQMLKKVQDSFAKMARMAALTTDENGVPITEGSNFSRLCKDFCRKSQVGRERCENCDKMGAYTVRDNKKPLYYFCHANLIDFAAPIMLNDRIIGTFVGGQVLAQPPDLDKMRITAREIGVDEEKFVEAAKETNVIPLAAVERSARFIYEYAELLSDMAYKAYVAKQKSDEAFRAAAAKTDFLANMSHEIRTPMNAIIGMAQIAMREEMSKEARNYMNQIMNSGKMLLTIINDILDYSKIDAGKMTLNEEVYSPLAMMNDIAGLISNRIGDSNIELILDVDPALPYELMGDDIRIKQIIVNLATNAVKFTRAGQVAIRLSYRLLKDRYINLECKVCDTGIGIKPENFEKLFASFEQIDSKRNREIEGTGLGLAIVKNLVELMNGKLHVESEYEKGSTFSFEIPQKIVNSIRSVEWLSDCPCVAGLICNPYVKAQMCKDMKALGVQYVEFEQLDELVSVLQKGFIEFIFIEENYISEKELESICKGCDAKIIILTSGRDRKKWSNQDVIVVTKPLSIMNLTPILSHQSLQLEQLNVSGDLLNFEAPDARILVVDDNEVNLTVVEGLLEPLHMQVELVESGKEAIERITADRYDLVFMDHMMPGMDGIETTHIIRRFHPEYEDVPIIALTANALGSAREMFLEEGMNDFVPKPIEMKEIVSVIRKWLPQEMIIPIKETKNNHNKKEENDISDITFLDTEYALSLLSSEKLYWKVLKDYYLMIDRKSQKIKEAEMTEDIGTYVVEVHALKSSSKQIGAISLSKKAESLEAAGNRHDFETIHGMTDEMLIEYNMLQKQLSEIFETEDEEEDIQSGQVAQITKEQMEEFFREFIVAIDELDLDKAEKIVTQMDKYKFDSVGKQKLEELKDAVQEMDVEQCEVIMKSWQNHLL